MTLLQNTIKYASLLLVLTLASCNQKPSVTHLKLESNQAQLEANLLMYETVWDKVINGRQIALINADSFDQDVTAVATSAGDVVGLENFKNYYNNYLTGFSELLSIGISREPTTAIFLVCQPPASAWMSLALPWLK